MDSGSEENCNSWSATMVGHMQFPALQGKKNTYREERKARSKQRLFIGWTLPRKGVFLLFVGLCQQYRPWEFPFLLFFLYLRFLIINFLKYGIKTKQREMLLDCRRLKKFWKVMLDPWLNLVLKKFIKDILGTWKFEY